MFIFEINLIVTVECTLIEVRDDTGRTLVRKKTSPWPGTCEMAYSLKNYTWEDGANGIHVNGCPRCVQSIWFEFMKYSSDNITEKPQNIGCQHYIGADNFTSFVIGIRGKRNKNKKKYHIFLTPLGTMSWNKLVTHR